MNRQQIIDGLNYWMDDYIDNPDRYGNDYEAVSAHLRERNEGREPSYGEVGLALMERLIKQHAETRKAG
jgi:hypothetical protein